VMVLPVDERHLHRLVAQLPRSPQPAKPSADNHYFLHVRPTFGIAIYLIRRRGKRLPIGLRFANRPAICQPDKRLLNRATIEPICHPERAPAVGASQGTWTFHPTTMRRDPLELTVAYALLELALWTSGRTQQLWSLIALVFIIFATLLSHRTARALGIGISGLRRSAWIIPAALALGGILVAAAWLAGTAHVLSGVHQPPSHAALYAVWSLLQQFLLQSFIFVRLESVLRSGRRAVLWSAVLFSVAHIPNPVLVPATLLFGLVTTELFRRYRNLYPLGFAHAVFGLALAISLPYAITHNMRVGIAYWL
jgi:hypothetical protein